jgi:hypothetical protein
MSLKKKKSNLSSFFIDTYVKERKEEHSKVEEEQVLHFTLKSFSAV